MKAAPVTGMPELRTFITFRTPMSYCVRASGIFTVVLAVLEHAVTVGWGWVTGYVKYLRALYSVVQWFSYDSL